jgi:hypothetical protein
VCKVASTRCPVSEACTGDLRGFKVPDLADHDDVGILAQDRAQCTCKSELDLWIDLGLADTVERIFDRVLDRHHVERAAWKPR